VEYLLGAPGIGKSQAALRENPGAYWKNKSAWWDGYQGHEVVILDEFDSTWFPWATLLKLLDSTPLNIEVKGGTVPFVAKKIVITTNRNPWDLYNRWKFPVEALFRRITTWRLFEGTIQDPVNKTTGNIWDLYQHVTGRTQEDWMMDRPNQWTPRTRPPPNDQLEISDEEPPVTRPLKKRGTNKLFK
jgi:hypothetical protein